MVEALGLSLKEFIFYLINFLILVGVLGKFLYKPFLEVLEKRKNTIQAAFDRADEKNEEAEHKLAEYEKTIANVKAESREIVRAAKQRADEQANRIIEDARDEADRILKAAQQDIERERFRAAVEMKDEIGKLAMMAAEQILQQEIKSQGYEKIVDEVIEEGAGRWQN